MDSSTKSLIGMDETPLSILEDCYMSVFSVARFYLSNSIEPNRALASLQKPESPSKESEIQFFNIANADCYRILSEDLDIMQQYCKYYVELSRYREATYFIREGLDLSQLHYSKRRLTQFLLHQINTDLVASNLSEAFQRLDIVERLLKNRNGKSSSYSLNLLMHDDIVQIKNYMHFNLLKIFNFIKQGNFDECIKLFDTHITKLNEILMRNRTALTQTQSPSKGRMLPDVSSS